MTGRSHDPNAPLDTEEAARSLKESELLVAHLVLRPFVDAYRVMAEELVDLGPGPDVDEQRAREMSAACPAVVATAPHHRGSGVGRDVQYCAQRWPGIAVCWTPRLRSMHSPSAGSLSLRCSTTFLYTARSMNWRGCIWIGRM